MPIQVSYEPDTFGRTEKRIAKVALPQARDGAEVRTEICASVGPRKVVFKRPEVPRGHYRIAVRTRDVANVQCELDSLVRRIAE